MSFHKSAFRQFCIFVAAVHMEAATRQDWTAMHQTDQIYHTAGKKPQD